MKVQVLLVSDQPVPNIVTALQHRPRLAVLLYSHQMIRQKERLGAVLEGKGVKTEPVLIDPYSIASVAGACEDLIRRHKGDDVSLNITGGTKVTALAAFQSFYTAGKVIYYVHTGGGKIMILSPSEGSEEISVRIPLVTYLAAHGFSVESLGKGAEDIESRREVSERLALLARVKPEVIGRLNRAVSNLAGDRFPAPVDLHFLDGDRDLVDLLSSRGMILSSAGVTAVGSEEVARYLTGAWFEEYVYQAALESGADEVGLNVEGSWAMKGTKQPRNEFDILVSRGVRLYYISCKTANADRKVPEGPKGREYLYEIDSLADAALGIFGKRMLASARPIKDTYVRQRAAMMGIDIIDGACIGSLKENLRAWVRG